MKKCFATHARRSGRLNDDLFEHDHYDVTPGDIVRAIRDGRKCQTRRVIAPHRGDDVIGRCVGGIDWVLAGCESGPRRRPMDQDWASSQDRRFMIRPPVDFPLDTPLDPCLS